MKILLVFSLCVISIFSYAECKKFEAQIIGKVESASLLGENCEVKLKSLSFYNAHALCPLFAGVILTKSFLLKKQKNCSLKSLKTLTGVAVLNEESSEFMTID